MLPDDLSPAESVQLEKLLGEYGDLPEMEMGDGSDIPLAAPPSTYTTGISNPVPPDNWKVYERPQVDLHSGVGMWNTHSFTLTPSELKKVLGIIAKRVGADLSAEIERLRNEVS